MRKFSFFVFVGMFLLSACGSTSSVKSKAAIKAAIEAHLKNNPQVALSNFNTKIESVKFQGDTAEALVKFVAKGTPEATAELQYHLKLEGKTWKVVSSAGGAGMGMHGGAAGGSGSMGGQGGAMGGGSMTPPAPSHSQTQPEPQTSH